MKGSRSPLVQRVASRHWNPKSTERSSSIVCTSFFPCPRVSAGVANHSTFVATVQLAHGFGVLGRRGHSSSNLPRGWRQGDHKHSCPRPGLGRTKRGRRSKSWRWLRTACHCSGRPACHRHHVGEHTPRERRSPTSCCGWRALQAASGGTQNSPHALVLVVLAVEVCGRWSQETQSFLSSGTRQSTF